ARPPPGAWTGPAQGEALAAPGRQVRAGTGEGEAADRLGKQPRAEDHLHDAAGTDRAVAALLGHQGAAAASTRGLVPPGGRQRYRVAARVFADAARLRLSVARPRPKKPAQAGFFFFGRARL